MFDLFGSSPLVRGQLVSTVSTDYVCRIIPARAGPTGGNTRVMSSPPDHPRSCGANVSGLLDKSPVPGSSPLVRGQQVMTCRLTCCDRIIPARAGPTPLSFLNKAISSDHPRSCGANWMIPARTCTCYGSSPLVRGQHVGHGTRICRPRIIPARAGPTVSVSSLSMRLPDHPRSCGANVFVRYNGVFACGSSPLVRGQRHGFAETVCLARIIPARAGPTNRMRTHC